jgi:hypothetical protein
MSCAAVEMDSIAVKVFGVKHSSAAYAIRKCAVHKYVREHAAQRDPGCERDLPLKSAGPRRIATG